MFFKSKLKTCRIRTGFEHLSSSIGWRVIELQSSAKKVARVALEGHPLVKKRMLA